MSSSYGNFDLSFVSVKFLTKSLSQGGDSIFGGSVNINVGIIGHLVASHAVNVDYVSIHFVLSHTPHRLPCSNTKT